MGGWLINLSWFWYVVVCDRLKCKIEKGMWLVEYLVNMWIRGGMSLVVGRK